MFGGEYFTEASNEVYSFVGVSWQLSAKARRDIFLGYSLQSTDYKGLVINQPKMIEGSKAQVNNNKL